MTANKKGGPRRRTALFNLLEPDQATDNATAM